MTGDRTAVGTGARPLYGGWSTIDEVHVLQLSKSAADALQEAREAQDVPDDYGVRVSAEAGPDGQTGLAVGFTDGPAEGDEVTEQAGTQLFIAPEVAEPLAESVIDVQEVQGGAQLVVRPQEE